MKKRILLIASILCLVFLSCGDSEKISTWKKEGTKLILCAEPVGEFEPIYQKAELEWESPESGFMKGVLTLLTSTGSEQNSCKLYWGKNGKKLEGYTYFRHVILSPGREMKYTFNDCLIVPEGVDSILLEPGTISNLSQKEKRREKAENTLYAFQIPKSEYPNGLSYLIESEPVMEFQIASDIHLQEADNSYTTNAQHMYGDILMNSQNSCGLFIAGDAIDYNVEVLWEKWKRINRMSGLGMHYYNAIGNHESMCLKPGSEGRYDDSKYPELVERFNRYATNDEAVQINPGKVYYDFWISSYHFIILGQEATGTTGYVSSEQLEWLDSVLKEGAEKARATFIFAHQVLTATVAGGTEGDDWCGLISGDETYEKYCALYGSLLSRKTTPDDERELIDILKKYNKNLFMFGGHSHHLLESNYEIYPADENYPTIFNTSSVGYTSDLFFRSYDGAATNTKESEFFYVYVYEDCIRFAGRDNINSQWLGTANFVIPLEAPEKSETD